jgi:hypothetical protein
MVQPDARKKLRKIAANKIIIDGTAYTNHVVELLDGVLVRHYPLQGEQAMTEWYTGTLTYETKKG